MRKNEGELTSQPSSKADINVQRGEQCDSTLSLTAEHCLKKSLDEDQLMWKEHFRKLAVKHEEKESRTKYNRETRPSFAGLL